MNRYNKKITILITYFLIYLIAKVLGLQLFSDFLSLTGTLLACFFIFESILEDKRLDTKVFHILLGIGCLTWTIAEIFRVIYTYYFIDTLTNFSIITILCFITNICFLFALIIFAVTKFKRWNKIQLLLDFIFIFTTCIYLIWAVFLDRGALNISFIINYGFISTASILMDILIVTIIAMWYMSIREGKIPIVSRLTSLGVIIFAFTNIIWYYLYFHGIFSLNMFFNIVYILPILFISIALLIKKKEFIQSESKASEYSNIGGNKKEYIVALSLIVLFIKDNIIIKDILFFGAIILIYKMSSSYIQFSINNEKLLEKEKNLNTELEKRIEERTKELLEKNELLNKLVNIDNITHLYNRRYFNIKIEEMISKVSKTNIIYIFFINYNKFKSINDFYGHKVGDEIQMEVVNRLRTLKCSNEHIFHFLRDEFVISFESDLNFDFEKFSEEIIQLFNLPFEILNYTFDITVNIGVTHCSVEDEADGEILINNANIAMYESQLLGPNKYLCFDRAMYKKAKRKNEIEMMLPKVNFDDEFELYYQPQFDIKDNKLIGMEALLRWHNPKYGEIPPNEFIPISENTNDILPIGEWVMENAIKQISYWNNKYNSDFVVGINVSPKQLLKDASLLSQIQNACRAYNSQPKWLDFEVTEGLTLIQNDDVYNLLCEIQKMNSSISLDDFGTGYSTFNTFRYFPFNRIKLPKQFIDDLKMHNHPYNLVKFFLAMSRFLNNRLIVEGVETKDQYEILREIGCKEVQGYYLGEPIPAKEFEGKFLNNVYKNSCYCEANVKEY